MGISIISIYSLNVENQYCKYYYSPINNLHIFVKLTLFQEKFRTWDDIKNILDDDHDDELTMICNEACSSNEYILGYLTSYGRDILKETNLIVGDGNFKVFFFNYSPPALFQFLN